MFEKLTAADFGERVIAYRGRTCKTGKTCFTAKEARQKAARKTRDGPDHVQLYRYRCRLDDCQWWHLTSSENRAKKGDPKAMGGNRARR